jgi:hypothetical protein
MSISSQSAADAIFKNNITKSCLASSFMEYGYTPQAVEQVMIGISDAQKLIDGDLNGLLTLKQIIYNDSDWLRYTIGKKLQTSGVGNADELINKALEVKSRV